MSNHYKIRPVDKNNLNGIYIFKDKKGKKRKELWKDDNFIKFI